MSYDRYKKFRRNGGVGIPPFIPIREKSTDYYEIYQKGKTRLDILSYKYYGDSDYIWLILQANPEYGPNEFMIPDKAQIRIPFPLDVTLTTYDEDLERYKEINGLRNE